MFLEIWLGKMLNSRNNKSKVGLMFSGLPLPGCERMYVKMALQNETALTSCQCLFSID